MSEDDMLTGDFDDEGEDRFDYGEFHCYDGEGSESDFDGYASDATRRATPAPQPPRLPYKGNPFFDVIKCTHPPCSTS